MQQLENIKYNRQIILFNNLNYFNKLQRLYISKSLYKNINCDQYFIKAYYIENGNLICQGYIYFYIDSNTKTSSYIGTYIKPEFRNSGLASLLTSSWIMFCLDNDIYNLTTNKKQRKPFLLYLLKTFSFEITNKEKYNLSNYTISICKKDNDLTKYLLFKNNIGEQNFKKGNIFKEDNYHILNSLSDDAKILDNVILSSIYNIQDSNFSYQKSLHTINKHKK